MDRGRGFYSEQLHCPSRRRPMELCCCLCRPKANGQKLQIRWLNYLSPNVRRGNITLREQLLILDLHLRWGNRWSKIARQLRGRTDNEIKNYWRTIVVKQAKLLKWDVNSKQFRDALRFVWMPRLREKIRASVHAQAHGDHCLLAAVPWSRSPLLHAQAPRLSDSGLCCSFTEKGRADSSEM